MSKKNEEAIVYQPGDIVKNVENNLFAKIFTVVNGVYRLGAWATLENAKTAKGAYQQINIYGMELNAFEVVDHVDLDAPEFDEFNAPVEDLKPTKSSLGKQKAEELVALAEKLGLDATGNKTEVLERLFAHYEL